MYVYRQAPWQYLPAHALTPIIRKIHTNRQSAKCDIPLRAARIFAQLYAKHPAIIPRFSALTKFHSLIYKQYIRI